MSRTVVITGAASGIGKATADLCREADEIVMGVDLKDVEVQADLSTPEGRRHAVDEILTQTEGVVDAVIACAGIGGETVDAVSVNYFGAVELAKSLQPALSQRESAHVVLVGSASAPIFELHDALITRLSDDDESGARCIAEDMIANNVYGVYPATKRALQQWVRRNAGNDEWAGAGIALNAVAPGSVVTPMTKPLLEMDGGVELMDSAIPMPLAGHAQPEEIAELLWWLSNPVNRHVTGQVIYIDGGAEVLKRGDDIY